MAIRSVQITPPDVQLFRLEYSRFLLVMLTEIALFATFATTGIFTRKKPRIHRSAMVLARPCLPPGATGRIPFLRPVFGTTSWVGLFGPVFCLGAALLLIRWAMTRSFDRWFAIGYAGLVIIIIASEKLALTECSGAALAAAILKL